MPRATPREVSSEILERIPASGRELIAAVLTSPWACAKLADLPGGAEAVERFHQVNPEWLVTWTDLEGGSQVTLSAWGADRLAYQLDDAARIVFSIERPGDPTDDSGDDQVEPRGKPPKAKTRRVKDLEVSARWYGPGDRIPTPRMPKVRGFVPLPFAEWGRPNSRVTRGHLG